MKKLSLVVVISATLLVACGETSKEAGTSDSSQQSGSVSSIDREETLAQIKETDKLSVEISEKASSAANEDICLEIDDEGKQLECLFNVVSSKAAASQDPSLCSKIGDKYLIEVCSSTAGL